MADLILEPRDGFFCKDGRGWFSFSQGRAHTLTWPMPPTLLGALCTGFGRLEEQARGSLLLPDMWVELKNRLHLGVSLPIRRPAASREWSHEHLMWPVPADALYVRADGKQPRRIERLRPAPPRFPTLAEDDDLHRESLWRARASSRLKPFSPPAWWTRTMFMRWLQEQPVPSESEAEREAMRLPVRLDVRLAIDPETKTGQDGMLFATEVVETHTRVDGENWEWAIACQLEHTQETLPEIVTLGRGRRLAYVQTASVTEASEVLLEAFARGQPRGLRLVSVTPTFFKKGWLPDGFQQASRPEDGFEGEIGGLELRLRSVFCARPAHYSGWDMAANKGRGAPGRTRRLVPPGSVYCFEKTSRDTFTRGDAEKLWMIGLGGEQALGFGRWVPGLWTEPGQDEERT